MAGTIQKAIKFPTGWIAAIAAVQGVEVDKVDVSAFVREATYASLRRKVSGVLARPDTVKAGRPATKPKTRKKRK